MTPKAPTVNGLQNYDMVWLGRTFSGSPPGVGSPPEVASFEGIFYRAESYFNADTQQDTWRFRAKDMTTLQETLRELVDSGSPLTPAPIPGDEEIRVVKLTVSVFPSDANDPRGVQIWEDLALDPEHLNFGVSDAVTTQFHLDPNSLSNRALARTLPIVITLESH